MNDGVKRRSEIEGKNNASEDKSNYKVVYTGDLVYNSMRMWQGASGISAYDGIVSPAYTVMFPATDINNEYIGAYFKTANLVNKFRRNSQGLTSDTWNLKYPQIAPIKIAIPAKAEQDKVADLLSVIDHRITAQCKLIESLKSYKRGALSDMFPKDGESAPRCRLSGFTDDWESCALGTLAIFNPRCELPDTFEYVDLESVSGTEMIAHRTESKDSAPSRAQRLAQTGDLFYQTVRPYQRNNFLFEKSDSNYVFSTGYAQMRPLVNGRFLLCLVQSDVFVKTVLDRCTGTGYPAINSNDLAEIEVLCPQSLQEQEQIGNFFKRIDLLVAVQQQKLDLLLSIKQSFLQQMFI